jgi:hypothetical protein
MMLQSNDGNSVAGASNSQLNGGQFTSRGGVAFNNTQKNWRKLVTPAHDSFKKLNQPDYSAGDGHTNTGFNTGNEKLMIFGGAGGVHTNSNETSMDTSANYSVKEFNPNNCDLKPVERRHLIEIEDDSSSHEEEVKQLPKTTKNNPLNTSQLKNSHLLGIYEENGTAANKSLLSHTAKEGLESMAGDRSMNFEGSSLQMKSLMKSFSNGNFQFYENLHKKYFDKAKDKEIKSKKEDPVPDNMSHLDDKSENNLFSLTSKTGTILGLSQLKQSIDSLKASSRMLEEEAKS